MTIATGVYNQDLAHISREKEGRQQDERSNAEGEVIQVEDGEQGVKGKEKDRLPEESLRMVSWVEVENERPGTAESDEVGGASDSREATNDVNEQALLKVSAVTEEEEEAAAVEQTLSVEEELAMMEEKWREQCAINETLKQRLADEEERFRVRRMCTDVPDYSMHTRTDAGSMLCAIVMRPAASCVQASANVPTSN